MEICQSDAISFAMKVLVILLHLTCQAQHMFVLKTLEQMPVKLVVS